VAGHAPGRNLSGVPGRGPRSAQSPLPRSLPQLWGVRPRRGDHAALSVRAGEHELRRVRALSGLPRGERGARQPPGRLAVDELPGLRPPVLDRARSAAVERRRPRLRGLGFAAPREDPGPERPAGISADRAERRRRTGPAAAAQAGMARNTGRSDGAGHGDGPPRRGSRRGERGAA
jgi:hypothetical protein